jgi:anti-sigma factor RsiW
MNESERQLVDLYLDDELPVAESAALLERLAQDPQAVAYLAERSLLFTDLRRSAKRRNLQQWAVASSVTPMEHRGTAKPGASRWLSWRPLAAAAAGIVLGMFCTSVVWAYSMNPRKVTLLHEGFEHSPLIVHQAFPTAFSQWSVDTGDLVGPEQGASPKEGGRMLRLEPKADDKFTRAHYIVNLRQIPAFSRSGAHTVQFQVSACPRRQDRPLCAPSRYLLTGLGSNRTGMDEDWLGGGAGSRPLVCGPRRWGLERDRGLDHHDAFHQGASGSEPHGVVFMGGVDGGEA